MAKTHWHYEVGTPAYSDNQAAILRKLEDDLRDHMAQAKPKRYEHSLSVAHTAEQMALAYGVDPFLARAAGILHDWDKVLSPDEQVDLARELDVDLGVDLELVQPLLHGMTTAIVLPGSYPILPPEVWQAISRHTIGAADMTPLDMVVFVADGIEPTRRDVEAIRQTRTMVEEHQPLDEVYWTSFSRGIAYVIDTERYLYPGTLDIYNELALRRSSAQNHR